MLIFPLLIHIGLEKKVISIFTRKKIAQIYTVSPRIKVPTRKRENRMFWTL